MPTMTQDALVVVGSDRGGVTLIPIPTPLTRLNYFDGKFLRADDLRAEQDYLRGLTWLSNHGLGSGVVYGYDTTLGAGDSFVLGPGLAIDGRGRVLLLPNAHSIGIQALIDASTRATPRGIRPAATAAEFSDCIVAESSPGGDVVSGGSMWIITIGFAEALCGEEDVYGRLCEEACATSTDRPLRLEGIVVHAVPLRLETPLATSGAVALDSRHLRSLVASAYFADEWRRGQSLISGDGLRSEAWCLGSHPSLGGDVPVALVVRNGATTAFLDPWTVRRERLEAPAKRYWAGRMAMRPWDAYLAQILQFQCQLHELLLAQPQPGVAPDPCAPNRAVLREAATALDSIHDVASLAQPAEAATVRTAAFTAERFLALRDRIRTTLATAPPTDLQARVLIRGGIVELPPAGYLPVSPGTVPVNTQVRRLLGDGLDYRFCVVRPDFPAHALETVQHMERISLLQGLDHPDAKPQVDILVPNGLLAAGAAPPSGIGFDTRIALRVPIVLGSLSRTGLIVHGAGRADTPASGGALFAFAGSTEVETPATAVAEPAFVAPATLREAAFVRTIGVAEERVAAAAAAPPQASSFWASLHCDRNVLALAPGETTTLRLFGDAAVPASGGVEGVRAQAFGQLRVTTAQDTGNGRRIVGLVTFVGSRDTVLGGTTTSGSGQLALDVEIQTTLAGSTAAGIVIRLRQHGVLTRVPPAFVIRGHWQGDPLEVQLTAGMESTGSATAEAAFVPSATALAAALLRENPDVLTRGNPVNAIALSALAAIGTAIGDDEFADTAAKELFPPAQAPEEATVTATLDWVLFHRRRDKRCSAGPAAPAPVRNSTDLVYRVDPRFVAQFRRLLKAGRLLDILSSDDPRLVDRVGAATFRAGSGALSSAPSELLQGWKAAGGGTPAATFAVTATTDSDTTETGLAPVRAKAIVDAVGGDASIDPSASQAAELPPDAEAVTLIVPQLLCHHVVAVRNDSDFNALKQLETDLDVVAFLSGGAGQELGDLRFDAGTANVTSGSSLDRTLADAYPSLPSPRLSALITFIQPGATTAEPLEQQARVAAAQAGAVVPVIVTNVAPPPPWQERTAATAVGWPNCPFVTVVVVIG
jgi:hypothetical protein